jgi:hypothetical protein
MNKKSAKTKAPRCGEGEFRSSLHQQPDWVETHRIVPLKEASRLSNLSVDSLKRQFADKIIRMSPRRLGMRIGDALMLPPERSHDQRDERHLRCPGDACCCGPDLRPTDGAVNGVAPVTPVSIRLIK